LASEPTHHITHKDGSKSLVSIDPDVLDKLESEDDTERWNAQQQVSTEFRKQCGASYGKPWLKTHGIVVFDDFTSIVAVQVFGPDDVWVGECCNADCYYCDDVHQHNSCRHGCTLARVA